MYPPSAYFLVFILILGLIAFFWVCFAYLQDPVRWIALTMAIIITVLSIIYIFGWHHLVRWSI